jgi:hypothetical protein
MGALSRPCACLRLRSGTQNDVSPQIWLDLLDIAPENSESIQTFHVAKSAAAEGASVTARLRKRSCGPF